MVPFLSLMCSRGGDEAVPCLAVGGLFRNRAALVPQGACGCLAAPSARLQRAGKWCVGSRILSALGSVAKKTKLVAIHSRRIRLRLACVKRVL